MRLSNFSDLMESHSAVTQMHLASLVQQLLRCRMRQERLIRR
jgi:hypothetical protein